MPHARQEPRFSYELVHVIAMNYSCPLHVDLLQYSVKVNQASNFCEKQKRVFEAVIVDVAVVPLCVSFTSFTHATSMTFIE